MNNFSGKVEFLWSVADLIRDHFKRGKYQDVILPLTVLRRIDCVLEPTKDKVIERYKALKGKLDNLDPQLRKASGYAFYNTSPYTFERLLADHAHLGRNLRNFINGFSENMREVVQKFDFDNTITKLEEAGLLYLVLEKFGTIDLHPDKVSNLEMGYIFEELIRKFNEALDENPGEHFTPREVIRLMVDLLVAHDRKNLAQARITRTVYDPCCGSGGMLTIAKDYIRELNPKADVHIFGQEVNPETFAICKSDLYIKSADGKDAEHIAFGSTLSRDQHGGQRFDYLITNPPYGKEWKGDRAEVEAEHARGHAGRFGAGLPRISDGQMLFLQHLLAKMKPAKEGGSRIAVVLNGSPLFTGDAGGGESEIRRWILENDLLDAIVALPELIFYNTGIPTYVWVLSNRKERVRKGKVLLIDATEYFTPMRRGLGDKRREISDEDRAMIVALYESFEESEHTRVFPTTAFGYRKITVERPLRLNFQASPERIARLKDASAFKKLAESRNKSPKEKAAEEAVGRAEQEALVAFLATLPQTRFKSAPAFERMLEGAAKRAGRKIPAAIQKAINSALSERDEEADIILDADRKPEADLDLRDYENVPLDENVNDYFRREVIPHVGDAWINEDVRDDKDGEVGIVGYEISFNRYFYKYTPPRPLDAIGADISRTEAEIAAMLRTLVT